MYIDSLFDISGANSPIQ